MSTERALDESGAFALEFSRLPSAALRAAADGIEKLEATNVALREERDKEFRLRTTTEGRLSDANLRIRETGIHLAAERRKVRKLQRELREVKRAKGFKLPGRPAADRRDRPKRRVRG